MVSSDVLLIDWRGSHVNFQEWGKYSPLFIWAVVKAAWWTIACQASLSGDFSMARILEWVATSYSRGSSWPGDLPDPGIFQAQGSNPHISHLLPWRLDSLPLVSPGKPPMGVWKWKWSRSVVSNSATPWTVAYQGPPSMGFSRQEYWSGVPFPPPRDLPDPGIKPRSPTLQADALPSEPPGKPRWVYMFVKTHQNVLLRSVNFTFAKFTCLKRITTDSCSQ